MKPFKNMPRLKELYLANNVIGSLVGCEGLTSLKKLHLRHNKIEKIEEEGLEELFPALEYLNLRTNKVAEMADVFRLIKFPALIDLNLINCPIELNFSSMNILICQVLSNQPNPKIKRFCKVEITDVNRLEAVYYADFEWQKAEEKRKAEEAEKAKQEALENNEG